MGVLIIESSRERGAAATTRAQGYLGAKLERGYGATPRVRRGADHRAVVCPTRASQVRASTGGVGVRRILSVLRGRHVFSRARCVRAGNRLRRVQKKWLASSPRGKGLPHVPAAQQARSVGV